MSREAMQMALEALEQVDGAMPFPVGRSAITALRQALANEALDRMAENARELGLDYEPAKHKDWCIGGDKGPCNCQTEQPADEPVAWANINKQGDITHTQNKKGAWAKTPLYTRPQPAAQWVGLTDEDIALFDWESFKTKKDCSRAIERALKEKNT